jgi:hypothetical protein
MLPKLTQCLPREGMETTRRGLGQGRCFVLTQCLPRKGMETNRQTVKPQPLKFPLLENVDREIAR